MNVLSSPSRVFILALALLGLSFGSRAQYSYTVAGVPYVQDFSALGTANVIAAGGDIGSVIPALGGWYFLESGSNANTTITAGTGSGSGGDTYHFGLSGNTERALGGLQSGSLVPTFGFHLTNNTGQTLNQVQITYTGETWRIGATGRSDRLDFQYSTNATALNNGTWTDFDGLDYENVAAVSTGSGSMLQSAAISATITGLSLAPGATLYIRWNDFNASGADDGLAVDDFSFTGSSTATISVDQSGFNGNFGTVIVGASSAASSFTVSGANLSAPLLITPPTGGIEIRTGLAPFATTPIDLGTGTVPATVIDVRFTPAAPGAVAGDVTAASTGATTVNVSVSGDGVAATNPTKLVITSINGGSPVVQNLAFSVTVQAQDNGNVPQNVTTNTDILLSLVSGLGSLGGTLTGTITAGTNSVTVTGVLYDEEDPFGVIIQAARTSGDVLSTGQSASFNVLGAATTLGFSNTPVSVLVGTTTPAFQVQALRDDASVATEFTGAITLTVSSGPGTFTGTALVNAMAGVATFSDIVFNTPGAHVLQATATGLTTALSPPIQVLAPLSVAELVVPQYIGSKTTGSANTNRTPLAACLRFDNLIPNTPYKLVAGMALLTDAPNLLGAGNLWNGTSFGTTAINNAFVTDGTGSSGPVWIFMETTGNSTRFDGGAVHQLRVNLAPQTDPFPLSPVFLSTATFTSLDIAPTALTPATSDDGAYLLGNTESCVDGSFVLAYDNVAGTGRPLSVFQVRPATPTLLAGNTVDHPAAIGAVLSQAAPSVDGDYALVIPIGANNPDGVRRLELRDAADQVIASITDADGTWPGGANTTTVTRRGVVTIGALDGTLAPDSDGDGTADCVDGCPNDANKTAPGICGCGTLEPGSPCDDGDPNTQFDQVNGSCVCVGVPLGNDCLGVPGGPALPGTTCNDNDPCTSNDLFDANCICVGTPTDTDGDGTPDCSDGCPLDPNKIAPGQCGCGNLDTDTDGDGTADCNDGCPADPNKTAAGNCGCGNPEPGTACDDGDPNTVNDVIQPDCSCAGGAPVFVQGNIVVLQAGDGSSTLVAAGNPIVLREFTPSGVSASTQLVPSTGAEAMILAGNAGTEGALSRSSDGKKLVFTGYAQSLPNATTLPGSTSAAINRAIGTMNSGATFAREQVTASFFSGGNPRGAAGNGTEVWGSGSNTGIVYYGPGAPVVVSSTLTNNRAMDIYNGQLFFSTGSGTSRGVWAAGAGTPTTTGNTSTVVVDAGGSASPYEFVFNPSISICYVADDRSVATGGGIQRWDLIAGVWTLSYTLGTGSTVGARGLEVDFSGADPIVYATTAETSANRLIKITDTGASSTATTLATAATNTLFRGVAFAPVPCIQTLWYADVDGDGFGDPNNTLSACVAPPGYVAVAGDDCPTDPLKQSPGQCGCNNTEVDTDSDGTADCNDGCPNDPNKIAPGQCGCGVADTDTDGDGLADCNDGCPTDPNKFAPGICGCGASDVDTDNDGAADCIDGCPTDPNKLAPGICGCGVPDTDTDGDGVADCIDNCPLVTGQIGSPCDDGNPGTTGDMLDANCVCAGTVQPCAGNNLEMTLNTDANGSETSWDLVPAGGGVALCSGSGFPGNSMVVQNCCVPDGCYDLRVFDSSGDGMCCAFGNGGYVLRNGPGQRIIDNAGDGLFSGLSQAGTGFCLPLGVDALVPGSCDQEELISSSVIQVTPNTAVTAAYTPTNSTTGYQFWLFNPDGGYSRRVFQSHASPGTGYPGPTPAAERSSYLRLSDLSSNPVPAFVLLNVRVRSRVSGTYAEFGPACRLRVDPTANCTTTQLTSTPDPVVSCGATNIDLTPGPTSTVWADEVPGVTTYQFEFTAPGQVRRVASNTRSVSVGGLLTNPLLCGTTYDVRVRVSFNNGLNYCAYGSACTVTILPCGAQSQFRNMTHTEMTLNLYPNPNRGDVVTLRLEGLPEQEQWVQVEVLDLYGRIVLTRSVPAARSLSTTVALGDQVAAGLYTIAVTVDGERLTERLVIQ